MKRNLAMILLLGLISGCATAPKDRAPMDANQNDVSSQHHQEKVKQLTIWQAQGRIAASKAGEGGNASFIWEHEPNFFKIRMFGPFGAGSAELTGSDKQVVFDQADGSRTLAQNPEQMLYKSTGLHIPVNGLTHWIKGLPSPQLLIDKVDFDQQGKLTYLEQAGWQIKFQKYQQVGHHTMPNRMHLERDDMSVKLIVKKWTLQ